MRDIRRMAIWVGCGLVVVALLVVGGMKLWSAQNPYAGLTLWRETQIPDETRQMLEQRVLTTKASIAASASAGDVPPHDVYESLAYDSYILGDLVTARETYEIILNDNAMYYVAWDSYANVLNAMGDYENAERAYKQALALAPDVEAYYIDLAHFLTTRFPERGDEARDVLEAGVAALGQKQTFMIALAEWYVAHGDCDRAIAHYKVVATINPAVADDVNTKIAAARATCAE